MLIITIYPATPETVYHPTILVTWPLFVWSNQTVFKGLTSFEVHLDPTFSTYVLETLTQSLYVLDNSFVSSCSLALLVVSVVISIALKTRLMAVLEIYSIQFPHGIFAFL